MATKLVHLFPTRDHYIPGVPAVECDVSPERAAELLAYHPPAFTLEAPTATMKSVGSSDASSDTMTETPGS